MDLMSSSFPGGPTARLEKRRVDQHDFAVYCREQLWIDGKADLARPPCMVGSPVQF
jgi:hypothetical protein